MQSYVVVVTKPCLTTPNTGALVSIVVADTGAVCLIIAVKTSLHGRTGDCRPDEALFTLSGGVDIDGIVLLFGFTGKPAIRAFSQLNDIIISFWCSKQPRQRKLQSCDAG